MGHIEPIDEYLQGAWGPQVPTGLWHVEASTNRDTAGERGEPLAARLTMHEATCRLHDAIRLQAARPFDQATYDQALQGLYRRYPTSEALLARAIARIHSGD